MITGKVEYSHTERGHQFRWWRADSNEEGAACLSDDCWEAITQWLSQPKTPPTPRERAKSLVDWLKYHDVLSHVSGLEPSVAFDQITLEIQAAIDAERATQ